LTLSFLTIQGRETEEEGGRGGKEEADDVIAYPTFGNPILSSV
jgi:hypothetical protein